MSIESSEEEKLHQLAIAVIRTEAEAVANLIHSIDESFYRACKLILKCQGKVVVIGLSLIHISEPTRPY